MIDAQDSINFFNIVTLAGLTHAMMVTKFKVGSIFTLTILLTEFHSHDFYWPYTCFKALSLLAVIIFKRRNHYSFMQIGDKD